MKENIISIREVNGVKEEGDWNTYDGFEIKTNKQVIKLLISNYQSCCEDWGYFMSEDDLEEFIGAELLDITLVDTALNTKKYEDELDWSLDSGDVMFVNINTSNGLLQFAAYNSHNGYYGHEARVVSEQLNYDIYL